MACFLVPTAEVIVTSIVTKAEESREKKEADEKKQSVIEEIKIPLSKKLHWLNRLLLGGAVLLAFEHLWHGEVVPWFPFLTAAGNPGDTATMLHEMSTVGVSMAILVTAVWVVMCFVADSMVRKENNKSKALQAGGAVR